MTDIRPDVDEAWPPPRPEPDLDRELAHGDTIPDGQPGPYRRLIQRQPGGAYSFEARS